MRKFASVVFFVAVLVGCPLLLTACQCPFHSAMCHSSHSTLVTTADQPAAKRAQGGEGVKEDPKAEKPLPFFGNAKCPVMGGKTDPKLFVEYSDPKTHTYAKIHLCCPGCTAAVKKDPATAYRKSYLDREVKDKDGHLVAKKGEPYDLKNPMCPVMGGKVAADQFVIYNGYKIGFCCADCEKTLLASPDKYLAKLVKSPAAAPEKAEEEEKPAAPPPTAHRPAPAQPHH